MAVFLSKNAKIYILALIVCFFMVGIPLIWMHPIYINPDSYLYISIADYYLFSNGADIRDAFTVGPVIPFILAIAKFATMKFVAWSTDENIVLLKSLAFFCYVVIFASAYKLIIEFIDDEKTFIALFFLFSLLPIIMDTLSLNGELVSVALISVLMVLFKNRDKNIAWHASISFFSILIIYTKLQAVPILLLLILAESRNKNEFIKTSSCIFSGFLIAEIFLYANGSGVVRNLALLYNYVSQETPSLSGPTIASGNMYAAIRKYFVHIDWIIKNLLVTFPILFFIISSLAFENKKTNGNYFASWKIWICVTFLIIVLPQRQFEHYLILAIPFIIKFTGPAILSIKGDASDLKRGYFIYLFLLFLLAIRVFTTLPDLNQLRQNWGGAFPKSLFGNEVDEVRDIIKNNPGKTYIHGWDYRLNSYLNVYSSKVELPLLIVGAINEREYLDNLISNNFDYVIDIINYTGNTRDWKYSLSGQNIFGAVMDQYYDLVYQKGGLQLYKKKAKGFTIYR
jgi:hypothetical protein